MAQFDVYLNTNRDTKERTPYLLDIQHDLLDALSTRMVVPLVLGIHPIKHLNPSFIVEGETVYLLTTEMAGAPASILGKKVMSLQKSRQEIIGAVDFLITGF